MRIPDHLTCLLRNLYAGQEATVRTGYGITDWFQTGKGIHWGCILPTWLFNLYAEYIVWIAQLDESQAVVKIAGEISITSDIQMTSPLWQKRRTKEPLDESEKGEWKSWLKTQHSKNEDHGIRSHHFMADRRRTMETVRDFIFLGSKVNVDQWLQPWN